MAFDLNADPPPQMPPNVKRFNADGTPTQAEIEFQTAMREWLKRLAAAIS